MLKIVCDAIKSDQFFRETSLRYKEILDIYQKNESEFEQIDGPLKYTPLYDILGAWVPQINSFDAIKENLPKGDDYKIVAIGISSISKIHGKSPHTDDHPTDGRFKRFHLPLKLTPSSKISVLENDVLKEYTWDLGKWMEFTGVHLPHFPSNDENSPRIVMLVDVFLGDVDNRDIFEWYETIDELGWFRGISWKNNYIDYVNNKPSI
jgi:hypothetical protein